MLEHENIDGTTMEKMFLKGLYESKKLTWAYGKEEARKGKEKQLAMQEKVALAQQALELDP